MSASRVPAKNSFIFATIIYEDSSGTAAVALSKEKRFRKRSKHISHRWSYVAENSAPKWANCELSALAALSRSQTSWHPLDLMTHSTSSETKSWVSLLPQPTSFSFEMRSLAWIPPLTVIHITKLNCQLFSKGRLLSETTHVTAYSQPNTLTTIPGQGGYLCEYSHFLRNKGV